VGGTKGSDLAVETSHELDVEGLERVARGLNKVDTRVNAVIDDIRAVGFILCFQVCVETAFNAFQNRFPTLKLATARDSRKGYK
jgi:hypothetical protein